jgi:hypothetical protein
LARPQDFSGTVQLLPRFSEGRQSECPDQPSWTKEPRFETDSDEYEKYFAALAQAMQKAKTEKKLN